MVNLGKPDVDLSSEQDISDTSTLPGKQEDYGSVPPKIRDARNNYLCVSKKGAAIEGQYFIDLSIPPPALHILSGAKNLSLYTTSGAVTADVWVTGNNRLKRVSLKLSSDNGHVCAKIHDIFYNGESERRPSLDIELWANYGDVSLSLPRCFRGPIAIRSHHERVAFSSELEKRTPLLSDVDGVRVYFVGDRPRSWRWRGGVSEEGGKDASGSLEEPLDELSVGGRHTSVRINWDGESELTPMRQNKWENFCMGNVRFFTSGRVN
ncbi:hypothetical protein EDB92DRAFT_1985241 [Lactarius akahatsu]|uniref:DUF7330 domain-containing protein n=1 Tax=Lactarius akahatsu TaxID=416441 RepID=A0AAD4LR67_9AGAM|nr:hypothetical protein EDB92DRAFT_1985241 [Lactarius akahatsu]